MCSRLDSTVAEQMQLFMKAAKGDVYVENEDDYEANVEYLWKLCEPSAIANVEKMAVMLEFVGDQLQYANRKNSMQTIQGGKSE